MVLVGLAVALLLVELVLRTWAAVVNPPIYELDTALGWRHARSVDRELDLAGETGHRVRFATDARGLRMTPHASTRTAGVGRVLFAGDSFTQGSQVEAEELFTVQLERAIGGIESFNAGVGGYSTVQELRALPEQLSAYAPDVVVLVVYDNDFQDNLMPYFGFLGPRPHVRVSGDAVEVVEHPDVQSFERFLMPAPGALWCYRHCATYRALHKNVFLHAHGLELVALEMRERDALPLADMQTAMAWLLARFASTVRDGKAELLVAAIPTREQAKAGSAAAHPWLQQRCDELGVPFVSLLPALHVVDVAETFFANDIHLTGRGHRVVAEALRQPLERMLRRGR